MQKNTIYLVCMVTGLIACLVAFTSAASVAMAGSTPTNLKVIPKSTSKKDLKIIMKGFAKALNVQCDHCHDMSNMSKDTEMKDKARSMIKMTNSLNKKLKKDGFAQKVECVTCHSGNIKPKQ